MDKLTVGLYVFCAVTNLFTTFLLIRYSIIHTRQRRAMNMRMTQMEVVIGHILIECNINPPNGEQLHH